MKKITVKRHRSRRNCIIVLASLPLAVINYSIVHHKKRKPVMPDYDQLDLTGMLNQEDLSNQDYNILFTQTGLGKSTIDQLLSGKENGKEKICNYQQAFFQPRTVETKPMLGLLTWEDDLRKLDGNIMYAPELINVKPGDIIITLCTHSLGWYHGHAGLILDKDTVMESYALGTYSMTRQIADWRKYSSFAVLRVNNAPAKTCIKVAKFAASNLMNIPYKLTAGLFGDKFENMASKNFGMHCAYFAWYAWKLAGYDLDRNHGRFVTPRDLLFSKEVNIVQFYGMDANKLLKKVEK